MKCFCTRNTKWEIMMFASFEENSKTQCGDREGREPFLLSNTMDFFMSVIRYPLSSPAGLYPAVVQRPPKVLGNGNGDEGLL